MKRWHRVLLAVVGLGALLVWTGARADEPAEKKAVGKPQKPTETLEKWQWYFEIAKPENVPGDAKYFEFIVPPAVFEKANVPASPYDRPAPRYDKDGSRFDRKGEGPMSYDQRYTPPNELSDLRLRDAKEQEIPYALFVRRKTVSQVEMPVKKFNNPEPGPNGSVSRSLEIEGKEPRHNEIEIGTSGKDFRRHVSVETSDDRADWRSQLDADLIYFEARGEKVNLRKFTYTDENRRRYVRVTVHPDPGKKDDKPKIDYVKVFQSVDDKGLPERRTAEVGRREPGRVQGVNGSLWPITFGGKRVPVETLIVTVEDADFERQYQLEMAAEGQQPVEKWANPFSVVQSGTWKGNPLQAQLTPELFARQLRLGVADASNPPLRIKSVEYEAPARQVIFARSAEIEWPVKVYCGNPAAQDPAYDFKTTVAPTRVTAFRLEISPGAGTLNPIYTPPPVAWSEQHPWLVYVVLGIASVVLFALMALLAKQALARTSPPAPQPQAP
jgi:hypothetical protein